MIYNKYIKKILALILVMVLITVLLTACNTNKGKADEVIGYQADSFAMGTVISQKVYGLNAETVVNQTVEKIESLEKLLTFNAPGGDINELNENAGIKGVDLNAETIKIIEKAQQISQMSNGAFDITVGPLVKLWGIGTEQENIPSKGELERILPLVDYKDLSIDNKLAKLKRKGQMVDLGGIAKGYAGDAAIEIYKQNGIKSAFINLGGNVVTLGTKPDGSEWKVGIRNPRPQGTEAGQTVGAVKVTSKAVVTAGDDQRYFENNGVRYHHILNPFTGYPAKSDLMSVTLITDSSLVADALDTAVFILGLEKGKELIEQYGGVEAVFITTDKKIYVTDGLKDNFEFNDASKEYEYVK